jgi:hypothetical protein
MSSLRIENIIGRTELTARRNNRKETKLRLVGVEVLTAVTPGT